MQYSKAVVVCTLSVLGSQVFAADPEPLNIVPDVRSISFDSREGPVTIGRYANDIMLVKGSIRSMAPPDELLLARSIAAEASAAATVEGSSSYRNSNERSSS